MRKANVYMHGILAGVLEEIEKGGSYRFIYNEDYSGIPISLSMPMSRKIYEYDRFPPFFDGLLPEGFQLEGLLITRKIDKSDFFSQLLAVGKELIGAVTIEEEQ